MLDGFRLAYVSEAPVNWCPGLGTVLSNEEVTNDGRSERGNFPVFKRSLRQWMMRISAYSDRLTDDLDRLDWPEPVKLMQRNWIGRSHGARVRFPLPGGADVEVFTTRPDTLFGATFMVLAPEHPLVDQVAPAAWPQGSRDAWTGGAADPASAIAEYRRQASLKSDLERQTEGREKTGVFTGAFATNPVNGQQIPVFVADYVLMGYGTGAIMAVPGQDERDWEFAEKFELPIVRTVQPPDGWEGEAFTGEGPAVNSANDEISLDGLGVVEAKAAITDWLQRKGSGEGAITYKLRDWLFSRQRYWGEPFPVVFDDEGRVHAVPDDQLPVALPDVPDYSPRTFEPDDADSDPEPPLGRVPEWVAVEMDLGDGPRRYTRETNTMPNWAGSCWYFLRYLDPANQDTFCDKENEAYWMGPRGERSPGVPDPGGVDLYVGGVEHAVLHLLYARFWHKVMHDLGYVTSEEPFRRYFGQGMIQAFAYRDSRGQVVPADEVTEDDGTWSWQGQEVSREHGKMGKSLKNVVTPDEMYSGYGADTFRVYEMSMGPLDVSRPWETRAVVGSMRFLQRLWRNVVDEQTGALTITDEPADDALRRALHQTVDAVGRDYAGLRFNTAVAKLIELNNHLTRLPAVPRELAEPLVLMTAPLAPHICRGAVAPAGARAVAGVRALPAGRPGAAGRGHGDLRRPGAGQGARPAGGAARSSTRRPCASWRWAARRCRRRWPAAGCARSSSGHPSWSTWSRSSGRVRRRRHGLHREPDRDTRRARRGPGRAAAGRGRRHGLRGGHRDHLGRGRDGAAGRHVAVDVPAQPAALPGRLHRGRRGRRGRRSSRCTSRQRCPAPTSRRCWQPATRRSRRTWSTRGRWAWAWGSWSCRRPAPLRTGLDAQAIAEAARARAGTSRAFFFVATLEHLRRGGRIGPAAAFVGSALAIKPLLVLDDGIISPAGEGADVRAGAGTAGRPRGRRGGGPAGRGRRAPPGRDGAGRRAGGAAARLRLPAVGYIEVSDVGAVIGTHVGPGHGGGRGGPEP